MALLSCLSITVRSEVTMLIDPMSYSVHVLRTIQPNFSLHRWTILRNVRVRQQAFWWTLSLNGLLAARSCDLWEQSLQSLARSFEPRGASGDRSMIQEAAELRSRAALVIWPGPQQSRVVKTTLRTGCAGDFSSALFGNIWGHAMTVSEATKSRGLNRLLKG